MAFENFASAMANARELIGGLAEMLRDGDDAIWDHDVERRIEPIEHEPRSGFWPWTSGGFEVCLPAALSYCWSTGSAPAAIQPMIDQGDRFIAEAWRERYPRRPSLDDCIAGGEGIRPKWQSEAEEWETEAWMADDDCYFWKARVMFEDAGDMNGDGVAPRVHIDAYLNTDLNYGRDDIGWLSAYGQKTDQTWGNFKVSFPLAKFARLQSKHLSALVSSAQRTLQ